MVSAKAVLTQGRHLPYAGVATIEQQLQAGRYYLAIETVEVAPNAEVINYWVDYWPGL